MVVNSVNFLFFFAVVFLAYYFFSGRKARVQNVWLLAASYFFYGFAEWKMLPLLIGVTAVFYFLGIGIKKYNASNEKAASLLTTLGTALGIGLLVYFKYLNFFIDSFNDLFTAIGFNVHMNTLRILMPLGISFFTFKLISYLLEIHRGRMEPSRDFISFATYISFFPTILSGPIDRPQPFLSQLEKGRDPLYDDIIPGLKLILWGMFLKTCVADRLGIYLDAIFNNAAHHNGTSLGFAVLLYPIQIYADFCGYSDMAIGVGRMLGIRVAENFRRPFFSQNIAEYWRKWHMSLTGWLTDYVFMPLNIRFRDFEKWGSIWAIIITFLLIGFWHGANWTFVLFGLYHGLLYIPLMLSGAFFTKAKKRKGNGLPPLGVIAKMGGTFLLVALGLILFRSADIAQAGLIVKKIATQWGPLFIDYTTMANAGLCMLVLFWKDTRDEFFPQRELKSGFLAKYGDELAIAAYIILVLVFAVFDGNQFIYFQF